MRSGLNILDKQSIRNQEGMNLLFSFPEEQEGESKGSHFTAMNAKEITMFILKIIAFACVLSGVLLKISEIAQA